MTIMISVRLSRRVSRNSFDAMVMMFFMRQCFDENVDPINCFLLQPG
jgi:hypothetical protein